MSGLDSLEHGTDLDPFGFNTQDPFGSMNTDEKDPFGPHAEDPFGDFPIAFDDVQMMQVMTSHPHPAPLVHSPKTLTFDCEFWLNQVFMFLDADLLRQDQRIRSRAWLLAQFFTVNSLGHRKLYKASLAPERLTPAERSNLEDILVELRKPGRLEHIRQVMSIPYLTRRVLSFFVVTYCSQVPLEYYVDRTCYPPRLLGSMGVRCQPEIQARLSRKENIVWINLHDDYVAVRENSNRTYNPYCRSTIAHTEEFGDIVLCEYNFFIWFISVAGPDIFDKTKEDVCTRKLKEDERQRLKRRITSDPAQAEKYLRENPALLGQLQRKKRAPIVRTAAASVSKGGVDETAASIVRMFFSKEVKTG